MQFSKSNHAQYRASVYFIIDQVIKEGLHKEKSFIREGQYDAGFLYILEDSCHKNVLKVGKALEPSKRLRNYNQTRPYDTCSYIYVSRPMINNSAAERILLSCMEALHPRVELAPLENHLEWFKTAEHKQTQKSTVNYMRYAIDMLANLEEFFDYEF